MEIIFIGFQGNSQELFSIIFFILAGYEEEDNSSGTELEMKEDKD